MKHVERWKGLSALVRDAVEHGSSAVERVHMATARRPFVILEQIPPIAEPVQAVHAIHDAAVSHVYGSIRLVNRMLSTVVDLGLQAVDEPDASDIPIASDSSGI